MDGYFPKSRCALQGDFMINGVRKVLEFRTRNSQHHLTFGAVLVDFRLLTFEMVPHVRVKANPPKKIFEVSKILWVKTGTGKSSLLCKRLRCATSPSFYATFYYSWLVVTGTMEFYDFPIILGIYRLPMTPLIDELHDFSEG